jgi:hypothetical protein
MAGAIAIFDQREQDAILDTWKKADLIDTEERSCENCKYSENLHYDKPCYSCNPQEEMRNWQPKKEIIRSCFNCLNNIARHPELQNICCDEHEDLTKEYLCWQPKK